MLPSKRRILYIEDHEDTRELMTLVLEGQDYEVTTGCTIEAGLRLAAEQTFDLYLLDTWLPDGSGVDLCAQIREFDARTPVLFYSAAVFEADKLNGLAAGAQGYVTKPCRASELYKVISRLIDRDKVSSTLLNTDRLVAMH
jgi:DNA-binding response OmpR family regulator